VVFGVLTTDSLEQVGRGGGVGVPAPPPPPPPRVCVRACMRMDVGVPLGYSVEGKGAFVIAIDTR